MTLNELQYVPADKYRFWVRYENTAYIIDANKDFLHGLFTALDAFNIPHDEVLLTKPYKHNIFYDVDNLQLYTPT